MRVVRRSIVSVAAGIVTIFGMAGCGGSSSSGSRPIAAVCRRAASELLTVQPGVARDQQLMLQLCEVMARHDRLGEMISDLQAQNFTHRYLAKWGPIGGSPPSSLRGVGRAQFITGGVVAGQSGCLACHTIGVQGNPGPGPDLTRIGSMLDREQLLRSLRSPRPPMPSFRFISSQRLADLVSFLQALR